VEGREKGKEKGALRVRKEKEKSSLEREKRKGNDPPYALKETL